jgi:DNA-binding beta-propeller fold protein YncE
MMINKMLLKNGRTIFSIVFLVAVLVSPAHAAFGDFLYKWGSEYIRPKAVALDSSGNVYVLDAGNNRVEVFSSTGVFLRRWGSFGTSDGQFNGYAWAIAIDSNNHVYVTEIGSNSVKPQSEMDFQAT